MMKAKTMMLAAFALATAGAVPAIAQQTGSSGVTGQGAMPPNMAADQMKSDADSSAPTAKMNEKQTAAWQKCQAMSSDAMMKNKRCVKMSKMQGTNQAPM